MVSLRDVRDAHAWRARSISVDQAATLIGWGRPRLHRYLREHPDKIEYRRYGRNYELDQAGVERLAAREEDSRARARAPRVCALPGCSKEVHAIPSRVARGFRLHCSDACADQHKKRYPTPEARVCGREGCDAVVTPTGSDVAKDWGCYCSPDCGYEARAWYPKPERRSCERPGCNKHVSPRRNVAARGAGNYCCKRCSSKDRWTRTLKGVVPAAKKMARYKTKWRGDEPFEANWWNALLGRIGGLTPSSTRGRPKGSRSEAQGEALARVDDASRRLRTRSASELSHETGVPRTTVIGLLREI